MQQVADVLTVNAEVIRPELPALYELVQDTLYAKLTKGAEKHRISKTPNGNDFRIPLEIQPPGVYGALSLDGGAFADGTGFISKQMYQTYFTTQLAIKLTMEAIKTTEQSSLSVVNAWKQNTKSALPNFKRYNDISLHNITGNQGLVALGTAWDNSAKVYTFDYEYGANLLQEGMRVEIFTNNLDTHKTTGLAIGALPYITGINKQARTAKVNSLPQGFTGANTDYLALPGVTATPTWMNGVRYFHDTVLTGNLLNLDRAVYPELLSNWVNASGALVPLHGTLLKARIRQRTGSVPTNLLGSIHDAQAAQIIILGLSISEWQRGKADSIIDPVPSYGETINFAGVSHFIDIHQSKKRIDWFNKENWGRVYLQEPDFYKDPGTGAMFHPVYNGDGSKLTAMQYFLYASENFYCVKPAGDGFIYGLTVETDFQ